MEEDFKMISKGALRYGSKYAEKFKKIEEGLAVPNGTLPRKTIVSVRKGTVSFSIEQFLKACEVLFENTLYIIFKSPKESRPNVTVLFWACDPRKRSVLVLSTRMRYEKKSPWTEWRSK